MKLGLLLVSVFAFVMIATGCTCPMAKDKAPAAPAAKVEAPAVVPAAPAAAVEAPAVPAAK